MDHAPDARRRLQRAHHAVEVWQGKDQRQQHPGNLPRHFGRGVVLMNEAAYFRHPLPWQLRGRRIN